MARSETLGPISYLTYISHTKYIVYAQYSIEFLSEPARASRKYYPGLEYIFMDQHRIKFRIEEILRKREQSLYWLSRTTGVSYTTLWRLTKDRSLGVNFATLEKLCVALRCGPGDLIGLETGSKEKSKSRNIPARSTRRTSSPL
jgi:putative transcriptional regulator